MDRALLPHLAIVLAVAKHRSFAAAAAELGVGASAVSHAVRRVERQVGAALFLRTTRSVGLTEAGSAFCQQLQAGFEAFERAADILASGRGHVRGRLRISASRVAQSMALGALIARAAALHPELVIEVTADEGLTDIVAGGYDAGVRLGDMIAADMVALRLTPPFRTMLVASPAYLDARGIPEHLADLRSHNCIGYRLVSSGGTYAWDMQDNGQPVSLTVTGSAIVTDPLFALDLAEADVGIAYVFAPLARDRLRRGKLREVLSGNTIEEGGLFIYFPKEAASTPKLRALIDLIRAGRGSSAEREPG